MISKGEALKGVIFKVITSLGKVTVAEILQPTKGKIISGNPEQMITNFSTDTRTIKNGDFFIPLQGEKYDGHRFIQEAIKQGAGGTFIAKNKAERGILTQGFFTVIEVENTLDTLQNLAYYFRKKINPYVIAITGSNGKTTTKELLGNILRKSAPTLVSYANRNNQIGLSLTLLQLEPAHRYCVLEMGTNHPGEIAALSKIAQPEMVIFTNIGKTHLQFFGSVENVFKEKISVLNFLSSDGEVIYNADDQFFSNFVFSFKKTGYGIEKKTDFRASEMKEVNGKNQFFLHRGAGKVRVSLQISGKFNIYNALAATAAAWQKGVNLETIIRGLENFLPLPGRMNIIPLSKGTILIDDSYNANPSSMRQTINWFVSTYPDKEKILLLGDMLELGEESKKEHYALGEYIAALPVKIVFLYGEEIIFLAEALRKHSADQVFVFPEKKKLIEKIKDYLSPKTVILFKASRAMKLEEVVESLIREHS